jgi:hypothetical protein
MKKSNMLQKVYNMPMKLYLHLTSVTAINIIILISFKLHLDDIKQ